jgi:hypothetical protein
MSALDVSNDADNLQGLEDVGRGGGSGGAYLLVPTGSPSGSTHAGLELSRSAASTSAAPTRRPAQLDAMAPFGTARQDSGHHQRYASRSSHPSAKTQSPLHTSDDEL